MQSEWRHIKVDEQEGGSGPVRRYSKFLENLSQYSSYEVQIEVENQFGKTRFVFDEWCVCLHLINATFVCAYAFQK